MVKIAVQIKVVLESLTHVRMRRDSVDQPIQFWLQLLCGECNVTADHWQSVNAYEFSSAKAGRGTNNAVIKCKFCGRQNTIDVDAASYATFDYSHADSGKFKTCVVLDCRGIKPIAFRPEPGDWLATGYSPVTDEATATQFAEVDVGCIEDPDGWTDYDPISKSPVAVTDFEFRFETLKG